VQPRLTVYSRLTTSQPSKSVKQCSRRRCGVGRWGYARETRERRERGARETRERRGIRPIPSPLLLTVLAYASRHASTSTLGLGPEEAAADTSIGALVVAKTRMCYSHLVARLINLINRSIIERLNVVGAIPMGVPRS
jgi:hypothetical protein